MFKYFLIIATVVLSSTVHLQQINDEQRSIAFTLDFYKQFKENENIVVSPLSIRILLSILYQNSFGSTEQQLQNRLYLNNKSSALMEQTKSLAILTSNPNVKILNKILLKNSYNANQNFKKVLDQYKTDLEKIDFNNKVETVNRVNQWVNQQTNGLIKNILTNDAINSDTAFVLLNSIYFKAQWLEPFEKNFIFDAEFTDLKKNVYKIPMMTNVGEYNFAVNNKIKAQIMELPYKPESNFVFWIILPDKGNTVGNIQQQLTPEMFYSISREMQQRSLDIFIPKFEIESSIDVDALLKSMGVIKLFENADLDILQENNRLKVDDIKQKTKIIVNTDGTEAATATYIKAVTLSARPVFNVNRPFIYAVLTADTKLPIFIGHFAYPKQ